jgi:hypothetical protein
MISSISESRISGRSCALAVATATSDHAKHAIMNNLNMRDAKGRPPRGLLKAMGRGGCGQCPSRHGLVAALVAALVATGCTDSTTSALLDRFGSGEAGGGLIAVADGHRGR